MKQSELIAASEARIREELRKFHTYNQNVANTLATAITERYYPAFCELQHRFAPEA